MAEMYNYPVQRWDEPAAGPPTIFDMVMSQNDCSIYLKRSYGLKIDQHVVVV